MQIVPIDRERRHFELREVWSDGTEEVQVCSLQDVAKQAAQVSMDRRRFLGLSAFATVAAVLVACSPDHEVVKAQDTCQNLKAGVARLALSPDGTLLASSSEATVRLWSMSDGSLVRKLSSESGYVNSVAFSPDGTLLASGAGTWVAGTTDHKDTMIAS